MSSATTARTDTRPTPSNRARRQRRARRMKTARNLGVAVMILLAIGAFLLLREHLRDPGPVGITAVLLEPRAEDLGALETDLRSQLSEAVARDDELILAAVLDGRDATVLRTHLACEPDENPLVCNNRLAPQREALDQGADALLDAPVPPQVDEFSTLGRLEAALTPEDDGEVTVILNLTGRSLDVHAPEGVTGQVDEVVAAVSAEARLPGRCDGWQVHVVAPPAADPVEDDAREQVYRRLVEDCGGALVGYVSRWPVAGEVVEVPELPEPPVVDAEEVTHERDTARREDTFRLDETLFDVGSADLRPGAEPVIDGVVDYVRALEGLWSIEVNGYADATGQDDANQVLSEDRAATVADLLRRKLAVDDQRIRDVGHGSLPDDGSDEARQANRRVDIVVRHTAPTT